MSRIAKSIERERERGMISGCQGLEGETAYGYRGSFGDDEKFLELGSGEGCTTL